MRRLSLLVFMLVAPAAQAGDFSSMAGWNALAGVLSNASSSLDLGMIVGGLVYTKIWSTIAPIMFFVFVMGLALSTLGKSTALKTEPLHVFIALILALLLGYPMPFHPASNAWGFAADYVVNPQGHGAAGEPPAIDVPAGLYYPYEIGSALLQLLQSAVDDATTADGTDASGLPLAMLGAVQSSYSGAGALRDAPGLVAAIRSYSLMCQRIVTTPELQQQAALVGLEGGTQIGEANPEAIRQREAQASGAIAALKAMPLSGFADVPIPAREVRYYAIPNSKFWANALGVNPSHCKTESQFLTASPGLNIGGMCLSQSAASAPLNADVMQKNFVPLNVVYGASGTSNTLDISTPGASTSGNSLSAGGGGIGAAQTEERIQGRANTIYLAPRTCFGLYEVANLGLSQYQNAYSLRYATAYGVQASWAQKYLPKALLHLYNMDAGIWHVIAGAIPGAGALVSTSRGVAALSTTKAYDAILQGSTPQGGSTLDRLWNQVTNGARAGMEGVWSKLTGLGGDYSMQSDIPLWIGLLSLGLALLVICYPFVLLFAMLPGRLGSLSLPYQLLAFVFTAEALSYTAIKVGGTLAVIALRITSNGASGAGNIAFLHAFAPIAAQIDVAIKTLFVGALALSYLLVSRNWHSLAGASGVLMSEMRSWMATLATTLGIAGGMAGLSRTAAVRETAKEAREMAGSTEKIASIATKQSHGLAAGGQRPDGRAALAAYMQRQGHAIRREGNAELGNQLIKRGHQIAGAVKKGTHQKGDDHDEH